MPPKKKVTKAAAAVESPSLQPAPVMKASEPEDHVLLKLPISESRLDSLIQDEHMQNVLQYNPTIDEPKPYTPSSQFSVIHDEVQAQSMDPLTPPKQANDATPSATASVNAKQAMSPKKCSMCYWCCHEVGHHTFGMPIRYDAISKNFTLYGTFCSLECTCAYNFSVHLGSDRAWEIHSWIQMLAKRFGYNDPIRPAPSKYLLKMFDGPLSIEEFRNVHKSPSRTYVLNVPPLVSISGHLDVINTSYLTASAQSGSTPSGTPVTAGIKASLAGPKKAEKKKTIDAKMNLIIEEKSI